MKLGKALLAVLLVFVLVFVTACSSGNNNAANVQKPSSSSTNTDSKGNEGDAVEDVVIEPLGKYDPPITLTMSVGSAVKEWHDGESDEDNRWIDEYANALGINVDVVWAVPNNQYHERLGVTIATGDVPDIMRVDKVTLAQLVESDLVEDLTEVYEKYASPLLKEILNLDGEGYAFKQATFDGKLLALPEQSANLSGKMLYIRKDWLDAVGLEAPKSIADVLKISEAFTKQDPNRSGKDDTFGLASNSKIHGWTLDLTGFINGFDGYPGIWVKDDSGNLVYGSTLPEMRDALLQLQKMYADGQIDPEFGVKDIKKVGQDVGAGKIGMFYGAPSGPISPFKNVKKLDPDLEIISMPILSLTGETGSPQATANVNNFYVVRKGFANPEAVVKLSNIFVDIWFGEQSDRYNEMITGPAGDKESVNFFQMAPVKATNEGKNVLIHKRVSDAINGSLPVEELNTEEMSYYDQIIAFDNGTGDESGWAYKYVFGPEGTFRIHANYRDNDLYTVDQFYGLATDTMRERWSTLQDMEAEVFPKIIMGAPIEEFDEFVTDWHNLGGKDITGEVNEWYEVNQ